MNPHTEPSGIKTTFVGQQKLIFFNGRFFVNCERAREAACQGEWALSVLKAPAVIYPNGKNSHEVAGETLDKAEDALISYIRVRG